jgi:hypothetical protein
MATHTRFHYASSFSLIFCNGVDNTNISFFLDLDDIYLVQFFAPSTGYYTNVKLFTDISNSSTFAGHLGAGIYTNDITTLAISPGQTQIENEKEILYSQCVEEIEKKDAP